MSFVTPKRGFTDARDVWGRNVLLLDVTLKKDGGYDALKKIYGDDGVRFSQLSGPLPPSTVTVNDTLVTPIQNNVPMDGNKKNVLQYWAYPNGEFTPATIFDNNTNYQPFGASNSGNPNGGTDYITTQPTQPTIPPLSQSVAQPNSLKRYADYRSVELGSKNVNWVAPQYYRSSYLASSTECAISTNTFVTTQTGPRGNFPFLQMFNGYKLLDDGVTVVPRTDDRSGEPLYVTCNPGLFPRDPRSNEYMKTMTNYCGKGNISFYQDSQYNANPNPNRNDNEGNPLGEGTLQRFDSNICQNFCTLYPTACRKPFQDWCSNINNWTNQGTCYAIANIVRSTVQEEQNVVVPTLSTLCQNTNLDTDVCKTFCFAANTSDLNCQAPLTKYCGRLVDQKLRELGSLVVSQNSISVPALFTFQLNYENAYFNTSPRVAPYNVGDAVILSNTNSTPPAVVAPKNDYKYISCRGYIQGGFLNVTFPSSGIQLVYHKFCSDSTNVFTDIRNYYAPILDTTFFVSTTDGKSYIALQFAAGVNGSGPLTPLTQSSSTISELYIWQGSGTVNENFAKLNGYRRVKNLSAENVLYTVCIALEDIPLFDPVDTGNANTFITPLQPLLFSTEIAATETVFPIIDADPFSWTVGSGGPTHFSRIAINNKTLQVGNVNSPVTFEINKFFSSYEGGDANTVLLALNPERANNGQQNAFLFIDNTAAVTTDINASQGSSFTITQPSGSGPTIKTSAGGNYVSYSNDLVSQAAEAVYSEHPQCPCFMPYWVYNHYYDQLFAEFPYSAPLQSFIETISTLPICNYPRCSLQVNGATNYIPRSNAPCPDVVQCLQNAKISVDRIGYLAKHNFQIQNTEEDLICRQALSTFSVYEDTGLFGVLNPTQSFYDILYNGNGLITMKVFRAALRGAGNTKPIIPAPPASFYGYIIGNNTLIWARSNRGINPAPNYPSVSGEANTLIAQGILPGTFLQGDPLPYGTGTGMYSYTLGGNNYPYATDRLGSASNTLLFTIQGDNPALINTPTINSTTPGAPSPVSHYLQTSNNKMIEIDYKVGDNIHVFETNRWRNFNSILPTPFMGYITTPATGNSVLHVLSNEGPIGPGYVQSINNVLPNTYIEELLSGVGKPFLGAGSTWLLNQRYTDTLGSATAPIQMFMTPKSTPRFFQGIIKEIYPDTVNLGYNYVTVNMLDTNESENQLLWSSSSTNYTTQNAAGQLAECLSIALDQDTTVLPSGEEITPQTWNTYYELDKNPQNIVYQEMYPEDKQTTSSSIVLIVVIIIIVLVLIIIVALIKIRQKKKLLSENENSEKAETGDENTK
jgi:hypothetical protein